MKSKDIDWEEVYKEYEKGKSSLKIGNRIGVSESTVVANFRKRGYKIRNRREQSGTNNIDWEEVYKEYEKGKSSLKIADKIGVTKKTVLNNFKSLGYRIMTISERSGTNNIDWHKVYKEYEKGCDTVDLAAAYRVTDATIGRNLRKMGYKLRKPYESYAIKRREGFPQPDLFIKETIKGKELSTYIREVDEHGDPVVAGYEYEN